MTMYNRLPKNKKVLIENNTTISWSLISMQIRQVYPAEQSLAYIYNNSVIFDLMKLKKH